MAALVTDMYNPILLTEAVQGVFSGKKAFMGSRLTALGIALVEGSMPEGGQDAIGTTIKVPRFGTIGEFVSNSEGSSLTPGGVKMATEECTITRDSLGFEVSRWARGNGALFPNGSGDPYTEAANQILEAAQRAMDKRLIDAAMASGVFVKSVYSTSTPGYMNWDLCVDAKFDGWGDEQEDVAAMLCHSQTHKDLMKLKDSTGRPLLLSSQADGELDRFCGLPVVVSDRLPLTGSTMGTVTSSGTSPPVMTITGTPTGPWRLHVDCQASHASTTTIKFSVDNGNTWSAAITVADDGVPVALTDTAADSLVGINGTTGISVAFASGTFNVDNLWTSNCVMKTKSLLLKKRALAFWYNRSALAMETDKNIRSHTTEAAMHLYGAAHRYARRPGSTKSGVVQIEHNVTSFV